ncbi:hypothetical protein BJN34_28770 [Cupriavidus necator]|uniref:Hydroxyquinol 1,2-dioxygenase n=1 Tax=Cupriavidus necator TaxID=106590 RepID=A0A1U9UYY7_CUPNE|nr:hypothetical protein [Cupriavidus necator]AQV97863.1 hypothetical protein BJN34_28770 [Cupriavidus necator]
MMPTRRILIAALLLTVLGSAAPFASAAVDPANDTNGAIADQVHRQRDPFTDGANNSARDPYLDGAHLPAQA